MRKSEYFGKVMSILNLTDINRAFGDKVILKNVTAAVEEGEKIGVVGINGAGKSTLLSIVSGEAEPDSGEIVTRRGLKISYLPQNPAFDSSLSVLENVAASIHGKEEHWDTGGEAKSLLIRFGITDPDCSPDILSGGQRKRAALIASVLTPCDLLILDEPTNHLDHEMIEWLEDWLRSFKGALLMVTHDRYFLDEVTEKIWELDRSSLYSYSENYSGYLEKKQERLDYMKAAERKMAQLYKQDLKWILRGARARSTKQKAHIRRFEALRDREKIIEERQAVIASMSSRLGRTILELEEIGKAYGKKTLFRDLTYMFTRTDRIGIIGRNGCGKSTLLKIMMGRIAPDTGSVTIGQTVSFGYFSQENEELPENERVIDCVKDIAEYIRTDDGVITASNMCERFLFDKNMQYVSVSKLSGGEKRRLYLLRVLMSSPNVLILDEPTNDLDIQTLQVLEDYLDTFNGVLIVVSHDRYFLDRVVTRIFSFENAGRIMQSEGAYTEYLEHKASEQEDGLPDGTFGTAAAATGYGSKQGTGNTGTSGSPDNGRAHSSKKLSYKEQREYDSLESLIDELSERSASLDEEINANANDFVKLRELTAEKEKTDAELEHSMERFFELQEKIDAAR